MNYTAKFIVLLFTLFMLMSKGHSQNITDPGIAISMNPSSVVLGSTGILSANVGNYGNNTIVANSLRVTISVGLNAEILGIAPGSDSRWTQLNLTTGSGNTILLTNSAGGFNSSDVGYILLSVKGNVVSGPDLIPSNIVYISAANPLLCGVPNCSPVPLNVSQGNASSSNDNSQTSLAVTAPTNINAVNDTGVPVNGVTGGTAFTNVLLNDMLNGAAVAAAQVNTTFVSSTNAGITLSGTNVLVAATTPAGSYSLIYRICEASNPTNCDQAIVSITVFCEQIAAPTVSVTQPSCSVAKGTITVTAPTGAGLTYSINGTTYHSNTTFPSLAPNSYNVTVKNSGGCVSTATVALVLSATVPKAEIVYAGASLCITVTTAPVTLTGTGGGTFSSSPTGLTINSATGLITPSESVVGSYLVTYTIAASGGCPAAVATTSVSIESCNVAEGCTLGYWKNHTNRWCSTYTPSMLFGNVFVNAPSYLANLTLLQALSLGLGDIHNLARQGVAAILNACSEEVDYPAPYSSSPQLVVNAVNAAFLTEGKAPGTLAIQLDILNNSGCPLGETSATNAETTDIVENGSIEPDMEVTLAPNPSPNDFGLYIKSLSDESITVRIIDIHGRLIRQFNSIPQEKTVLFGRELSRGLYFIEVIQGDKRKVVKAQKI